MPSQNHPNADYDAAECHSTIMGAYLRFSPTSGYALIHSLSMVGLGELLVLGNQITQMARTEINRREQVACDRHNKEK